MNTLRTYARPVIGSKPVDLITTDDILKILGPIWTTKTETAKRLRARIENVLDYASVLNYRDRDKINPARWRGYLQQALLAPSKVKTVEHHPAMPWSEVPAFIKELETSKGNAALALQFLILTATRTSEVLKAQWHEVDLDQEAWTVPASRMKAKKEHRIPLSQYCLEILKQAQTLKESEYIFPGARHGKPLSGMALLQLMRRFGYGVNGDRGPCVPHGFRSSFRDWAGETTAFPRDVVEMALAHTIENKVEAAYRRGDLFEKRKDLMQAWADYLGGDGDHG